MVGVCSVAAVIALGVAADDRKGLPLIEAVRLALETDPNILLAEQNVVTARSFVLSAESRFEGLLSSIWTESQQESPTSETTSQDSDQLTGSVSWSQEFRTGLTLDPEVIWRRTGDDGSTANVATVALGLRMPLLRDRGRTVVTANLRSSEQTLAASDLDRRHTIATRIFLVASAYWRLVAEERTVEILEASRARSEQLFETTQRLIEADLTPAAELVQVRANLAAKENASIRGQRDFFAAQQALGREIGLEYARIRSLGPPADPLPRVRSEKVASLDRAAAYIDQARRWRGDFLATQARLVAAEILETVAGNGLLPRLDARLTPSYSGLVDGRDVGSFFAPVFRNVPGLSVTFGVSLSLTPLNRAARAADIRARSDRERQTLLVTLASRQLEADVPVTLDAVLRSIEQLEIAESSLGLFRQAVENEEKKLRAGSSTLINVITQQDRLTGAEQSLVGAELNLALALLDLRFQTGTITTWQDNQLHIQDDHLTTVPALEE